MRALSSSAANDSQERRELKLDLLIFVSSYFFRSRRTGLSQVLLFTSRFQHHLKLDLIAERNTMFSNQGNLRFEHASLLNGVAMDGDQDETSFLVKAEGVEIIVGGNQPEARTASAPGSLFDGTQQQGPDALLWP